MNKKGQVLSLDVIFSIVLIILMFFLLFNIVEASTYRTLKDIENKRLDNIGNTAVIQILNNPLDGCYAENPNNRYFIPACLSLENSEIKKYNLGIPHDYNCSITRVGGGNNFTNNECSDAFTNANAYFSINFEVSLVDDLNISRDEYINNLKGNNNHFDNVGTFNLRVWKE